MDDVTSMMLDEWAKHQITKPTEPEDYLANIDHLRRRADQWEATNDALRLIVGTRLADNALRARMEGKNDE